MLAYLRIVVHRIVESSDPPPGLEPGPQKAGHPPEGLIIIDGPADDRSGMMWEGEF